jgi:hypothetical protein
MFCNTYLSRHLYGGARSSVYHAVVPNARSRIGPERIRLTTRTARLWPEYNCRTARQFEPVPSHNFLLASSLAP